MTRTRHLRAVPAGPVVPVVAEPLTLDEAFRSHAAYVAGVAYRILGRRVEVDDVVQEVFIQAQGRLASLRDPGALRAWLATITVRVARRRIRTRWWRQLVRPELREPTDMLAATTASPEEVALLRELYGVLDRLPVDQRLAWSVRHIEGERLEAVALLCGCSLATAKRRIAAAQARINEELDDE